MKGENAEGAVANIRIMKAELRFYQLDKKFWNLETKPNKTLEEIGQMFELVKQLKNNSYFRVNRKWLNKMDRDERMMLVDKKYKELWMQVYER